MVWAIQDLVGYVLVFFRISSLYFALPIFGDNPTPVRVRLFIALATATCIAPLLPETFAASLKLNLLGISIAVLREILIGIVVGYAARLAFDGLIMAASVVGYQMGFGTAHLFVPDANIEMDGFTALHRIIMILIFFSLNLHHSYIFAISETFRYIPIGGAHFSPDYAAFFTKITAGIFVTAMQLAAPVLVALMFTMAALGLIARAVPQFNVFVVSFPVSFFIGLLAYIATFPFLPGYLHDHYLVVHDTVRESILGLK